MYELSKTHQLSFRFVNGPTEAPAAPGIAEQFQGPYYRFYSGGDPGSLRVAELAQAFAADVSLPEDYARKMQQQGLTEVNSTGACDYIEQVIQEPDLGPFDGILGFSEGASAAASLLLRQAAQQHAPAFKFAVFFCGIPPAHYRSRGFILADESSERIRIPTAHIVGSKDPGHQASLALYHLCGEQSAGIYDHKKGHTIPWDPRVTQGVVEEIRAVISRSGQSGNK